MLKAKLFSASGNALKLLERGTSFRELHKKYNRATPTQFQKYMTAVSFFDLVKCETPEDDWINLQFNIQNDRRNPRLTFQTNNRYKCGLNCISNRFKSVSNEINKDWIDQSRDSYKTNCKKRLITDKLMLMWLRGNCIYLVNDISFIESFIILLLSSFCADHWMCDIVTVKCKMLRAWSEIQTKLN